MHEDKPERRQWLDENDFVWDDYERRWEDAQSALTTYKKLNGDMRVPKAFEEPSSAPWGEELWGMKLGIAVSGIRSRERHMREDKPERRQWLDENDFVWDDYERRWEDAQSAP
jgi:predicted PolB exonuclease-like 3'-5' exonuclease